MSEAALMATGIPGWFGKLPNLGDFASRRLPDAFVDVWDAWLQQSLAAARESLGPAWLDCYLVAPIRRFWFLHSATDSSAWVGLLMPSVDRVGRHYPFTVARPVEPTAAALATALAAVEWFDAVDAAARAVLDTGYAVDDLEAALADLPTYAAASDAQAAMLARAEALWPAGGCGSVWWLGGLEQADAASVFDGLPPAAAFTALLEDAP